MTTIGVLALQGAVREHIRSARACGAEAVEVKRTDQLENIDGLIIPGGESTAISRLINSYGFYGAIQEFAQTGRPVFGTCAGLILMASEIEGDETKALKLMDTKVARNAFGRQVASFEAELDIASIADSFHSVFIRAPYITVQGPEVEVLARYNGHIVAAKQGYYLCTAFHPELTDDNRVMAYFIKMVEESKQAAI